MKSNNVILRATVVSMAVMTLFLSGCAQYEHTKGLIELKFDKPDEGVADLKSADKRTKTNAEYKVDFLRNRDEQIRELLVKGDEERAKGDLEAAKVTYERALKMDPQNARAVIAIAALKQDARNVRLLTDGEVFLDQGREDLAMDRASQVLADLPNNRRALQLRDAARDKKSEKEAIRFKEQSMRNVLEAPVTLQFSEATLKSVFESLSKSVNLNILFDRDVKQDAKVTIYVTDVSVSDVLDLLLLQNQLRKRVINGNTLMIYPASAAKVDEYEDLVIKTFQVTNSDIKYLTSMLSKMLKIKEMSADEKTGILVVRDTPENLRLAERLIAAHDVPDPEVLLEVQVLEVKDIRDSNIGVVPPTGITISTPTSTTAPMTVGALDRFKTSNLLVSSLSGSINFKLEDSTANLLASPHIRARNKETAKIMIGDRVPTITNTVTPVNTGPAVVTGNVTYQDVGLKLEFEPQVYAGSEVGIKLTLEVSNIANVFTDTNGSRSYQIGTRNAQTNLRLQDGQTQILGGLITDQDRNDAQKIPGLGHLPLIGNLFGNNAGQSNRSEIVLAITPHIVRNLAVRQSDVKDIFSGTFNVVRERPLLADSGNKIKVEGTFGGTGAASSSTSVSPSTAGGPSSGGGVLVNPAPPKPQSTGFSNTTPAGQQQPRPGMPLSPAPAMVARPPVPPSVPLQGK